MEGRKYEISWSWTHSLGNRARILTSWPVVISSLLVHLMVHTGFSWVCYMSSETIRIFLPVFPFRWEGSLSDSISNPESLLNKNPQQNWFSCSPFKEHIHLCSNVLPQYTSTRLRQDLLMSQEGSRVTVPEIRENEGQIQDRNWAKRGVCEVTFKRSRQTRGTQAENGQCILGGWWLGGTEMSRGSQDGNQVVSVTL